jgi:hypothetical protein
MKPRGTQAERRRFSGRVRHYHRYEPGDARAEGEFDSEGVLRWIARHRKLLFGIACGLLLALVLWVLYYQLNP